MTHFREQGERYGLRFLRRGKESWLNIYDFDYEENEWKVIKFDSYNKEWLEFISKCRSGKDDSD